MITLTFIISIMINQMNLKTKLTDICNLKGDIKSKSSKVRATAKKTIRGEERKRPLSL